MDPRPISVLIVDDEPVLRELVAFILLDHGFTVAEAASGNAAYSLLQEKHFDVVISDVRMPDGSGVDLLKKIGEGELIARPRVFLVSGYAEISPLEAKNLGACDLLTKPVDFSQLCASIIKIVRPEEARA